MLAAPIARIEQSLLRLATVPGNDRLSRVVRQVGRGAWTTVYHGRHPLCRGRRAHAVGNLWAWQAWRRVVKQPLVVELQTGTKLLCPVWSTLAGAWVSIGVHEPELFFVFDSVRPGDVFVDVGANIGVYAVTAALRGAQSLAFEPTSEARTAIERNAVLNGVGALVTSSAFALSDYEGSAQFTVGQDCTNQLASAAEGAGMPVSVKTLDSCLAGLIAPAVSPDLIKIDVEGSDDAVLRGASDTLARHRPTLIVEIWGGGGFVRQFLDGFGYRAYAYDYRARVLNALRPDHADSGNLVAIHPDRLESTQARLRSAPPWPRAAPLPHWDLSRHARDLG